jgi:hypothetical protein
VTCNAQTQGYGTACTGASGCAGTLACNAAGTALECNAPASCAACSPQSAGYGTSCTATNGCRGVRLCAGSALACVTAESCAPHLVISEFSSGTQANGAEDEFVEVHNPTGVAIDLANTSLWFRAYSSGSSTAWTAGGNTYMLAAVTTRTLVPPGGYYLFAAAGYAGSVAPDKTYATANVANTRGQLWLLTGYTSSAPSGLVPTSSAVVDMVGYGTGANTPAQFKGASSAPGTTYTSSTPAPGVERKAYATSTAASMAGADAARGNGQDADNNGADFVVRTSRDPQNSSSPAEP